MTPEISDEVLGAYVDRELDPALTAFVEAAANGSAVIRRRLDAIRRVTAFVRSACGRRDWNISGD